MAGQCAPGFAAAARRAARPTQQALSEHRAREHRGAHPYRVVLGEVRRRLINTRRRMEDMLAGQAVDLQGAAADGEWYATEEQLVQPLLAVYW